MNHPLTDKNTFNIAGVVGTGTRIYNPVAGLVDVDLARIFESSAREALLELEKIHTDKLAEAGFSEEPTAISRARVILQKVCKYE